MFDDFCEDDLYGDVLRDDLKQWCQFDKRQLTIAFCISDSRFQLSVGLNLPSEVYQSETRVLIRQEILADLGDIIHNDTIRFRNVKVFGMLEQGSSNISSRMN